MRRMSVRASPFGLGGRAIEISVPTKTRKSTTRCFTRDFGSRKLLCPQELWRRNGELIMEPREQRAILIAATCRIDRSKGVWLVPSQSANGRKYQVSLEGDGKCECPDCAAGFT